MPLPQFLNLSDPTMHTCKYMGCVHTCTYMCSHTHTHTFVDVMCSSAPVPHSTHTICQKLFSAPNKTVLEWILGWSTLCFPRARATELQMELNFATNWRGGERVDQGLSRDPSDLPTSSMVCLSFVLTVPYCNTLGLVTKPPHLTHRWLLPYSMVLKLEHTSEAPGGWRKHRLLGLISEFPIP